MHLSGQQKTAGRSPAVKVSVWRRGCHHSPLIVIHEFQHDDRQNSEEHSEEDELRPAAEDISPRHFISGFLHGLAAPDEDLVELAFFLDHPQRFLDLVAAVAQLEDRIPQRDGSEGVVIALRAQRHKSVFADREVGQLFGKACQCKGTAGKDELDDQHEGHDRHRRRRTVDDAGDEERGHVCGVGDQEQGDPDVHKEPLCDEPALREFDAGDPADRYGQQSLHHAEEHLVDQVRGNIRGYVHSRAMFALDDRSLAADDLDGIKETVPDADAAQRQ